MVILGYVRLMIKLTSTTTFLNPPLAAPLLTMAPHPTPGRPSLPRFHTFGFQGLF